MFEMTANLAPSIVIFISRPEKKRTYEDKICSVQLEWEISSNVTEWVPKSNCPQWFSALEVSIFGKCKVQL